MEERLCRKCGEKIPYKVNIDGIVKSLQNRKFCLNCSPWNKHNTSPYDPIKREHGNGNWETFSDKRKFYLILSSYKRALERKQKLIEMSGGKCISCGYNKLQRCLSFHHLNPVEKLFGLSLNNLWNKSWEEIENEWKKCELLCLNCHSEKEGEKQNIIERVNEKYGTNFK